MVQNLLISAIVGCFAATAQDLTEKRLGHAVKPAWFAIVYLPFLPPPVVMHTQQPFRTTWSGWTELFLVFMLVAMYLRGTKLNKKELCAIVVLGMLAASWRSECVYYLAAIPVLLLVMCARKLLRPAAVAAATVLLFAAVIVLLVQRKWMLFFAAGTFFARIPLVFLTAPDTYFLYYLTPFIAGYAVAAAGVLYAVMRRKLKVERNPG